jgi:hypothetical protein
MTAFIVTFLSWREAETSFTYCPGETIRMDYITPLDFALNLIPSNTR